mmetsp:Transcript_15258/g.41085  ORF Transcript_15258/g.41085 Transcript_15258/m.41085 type:complete len:538 (+) Transcript_15258:2-1615(+)
MGSDERQRALKTFRSERGVRVMLLSLKAGGVGLNLTAARRVFLLDPWWNPAKERQAQDRVWRLNSPHDSVYFYNFFTEGTVDEQFEKVKRKKEALYNQTIRRIEDTISFTALQAEGQINVGGAAALARTVAYNLAAAGFEGVPKLHQVLGITWLTRQERGDNPVAPGVCGGILADDMGLGKTFQMLATIALDAGSRDAPTLVVSPKTAFASWKGDAAAFMPSMRVHVWHKEGRLDAAAIAALQAEGGGPLVLLTNYHHLRDNAHEGLNGTIFRRLILDESQHINRGSYGFENACHLDAPIRWSVSGTPITNELSDFEKHLALIGSSVPKEEMATDQLHGVALRRTKLGVTRDGERLPKCFVSADWLHMGGAERTRYEEYIAPKRGFGKFTGGRQKSALAHLGEPWAPAARAHEYTNPERERDRYMWMWWAQSCPACGESWPAWALTISAKETAFSQCKQGRLRCCDRPEFGQAASGGRFLTGGHPLTPSRADAEAAWAERRLVALHPTEGEQFFAPICDELGAPVPNRKTRAAGVSV